ncbi:MAG: hypothetical protein M0R33_17430 [Methylomonas sp.]|jgi:hypothetical protein|uniref:hypothetical protein n=1 Tax=Methylomonas sp. TaxID=418 RepID=UPI0025FD4CF3|nr:hypothetical protein [Methylomonas sp.]MCK9608230.1 hypothetical protein [Methylomonas sp.]
MTLLLLGFETLALAVTQTPTTLNQHSGYDSTLKSGRKSALGLAPETLLGGLF